MLGLFPPEILSDIITRLWNDALTQLILTGDKSLLKKIRCSPSYVTCLGTTKSHKLLLSFFKNVKEIEFNITSSLEENLPAVISFSETVDTVMVNNKISFGPTIGSLLEKILRASAGLTKLYIMDKSAKPEQVIKLLPQSVTDLSMCLGYVEQRVSRAVDSAKISKSIPKEVSKLTILSGLSSSDVFCNFVSNLHDIESFKFYYYGFSLDENCAKSLPKSLTHLSISSTYHGYEIDESFISNLPGSLRRITISQITPPSLVGLPAGVETVVIKFPGGNYQTKAESFPPTVKHLEIHEFAGDIEVEALALKLETFHHVIPSWMGVSNTKQSATGRFLKEKRRLANL